MEILVFLVIHLVVPLAGLSIYLTLCNRMREANIVNAPYVLLFIIFATYGGSLMVVLTRFFWYWSGLAMLGLLYLIFVAPFVMSVVTVLLYPQRKQASYHRNPFILSIGYVCLFSVLVVVGVVWSSLLIKLSAE